MSQLVRHFTLFSPEWQEDPNPLYQQLRTECPVAYSEEGGGFYILSRYEDVRRAARDTEHYATHPILRWEDHTGLGPDIPMMIDPPEHGQYREIITAFLSAKSMSRYRDFAVAQARELLEGIKQKGTCEFLADFAVPFPSRVYFGVMGLPAEEIPRFQAWKEEFNRAGLSHDKKTAEEVNKRVYGEMIAYWTDHLLTRRAELAATSDPEERVRDLGSVLASGLYGGERPLTDTELVNFAILVTKGGLDTVTNTLGLAMAYLSAHTTVRDELVADPGLVPSAVEEFLRHQPVISSYREVVKEHDVHGVTLKRGDWVLLLHGAAARDPEQFDEPDRLDVRRSPNRHLSFGVGPHRCVGSHLARMELTVAMEEIHRMIPDYRRAQRAEVHHRLGYLRGIDRLDLVVG